MTHATHCPASSDTLATCECAPGEALVLTHSAHGLYWQGEVATHYGQSLAEYVEENYSGDYATAYADFVRAYELGA